MAARGETLGPESLVQSKYYSVQGGYAAMKQVLGRDKRPTAVIVSDDWSAIGAMNAVRDMGLAVPDDISIAGFDGFEAAQHMPQKLTTIMQDTTGMGTKAAENLIKQILGVGGSSRPERILLEPKLVIGDSCRRIY
jgi:LacI family transcriptional regulator